jgi:pyruvate kinase
VLRLVEGYQWRHGLHGALDDAHHRKDSLGVHAADAGEALSRATSLLSRDLEVRAVVVPTRSGRTARLVSAERPAAPVIALTSEPALARRLSLCWGLIPQVRSESELLRPQHAARDAVRGFGLAKDGHPVLLVWDASMGAGAAVEPTVSILKV